MTLLKEPVTLSLIALCFLAEIFDCAKLFVQVSFIMLDNVLINVT